MCVSVCVHVCETACVCTCMHVCVSVCVGGGGEGCVRRGHSRSQEQRGGYRKFIFNVKEKQYKSKPGKGLRVFHCGLSS